MIYETIKIDDTSVFDDARRHLVNYILDQGTPILRYPEPTKLGDDPKLDRPPYGAAEFGVVTFDRGMYAFAIKPFSGSRSLNIVIGCENKGDLEKRVGFIKEWVEKRLSTRANLRR